MLTFQTEVFDRPVDNITNDLIIDAKYFGNVFVIKAFKKAEVDGFLLARRQFIELFSDPADLLLLYFLLDNL